MKNNDFDTVSTKKRQLRGGNRKPGLPLKERLAYALSTAKGVPIEADLRSYETRADSIRTLRAGLAGSAFEELSESARRIKGEARSGRKPDPILVFALAAEFSERRIGLSPCGAQLIAGLAMAEGKLIQMETGEGKTLAAALAVSLEALSSPGVHVLTANDYLARRDAEWMGPIYSSFGLNCAFVNEAMDAEARKAAYRADIVYLTAREAGFDHLRDGLQYSASDRVQAPFEMALVDEADFILIDEARIPLIIAGKTQDDGIDPKKIDRVALALEEGKDYLVDRRALRISIPLLGVNRAADLLGVAGPHEREGLEAFARLHAALHARRLLRRDFDYIVRAGKIELVDEFSGRVAERRKWPFGVQAALEAKEGLSTLDEGRVYGSITVQHFIGLYPKLAAMTATAVPSAEEFSEIYGLSTVVVPREKPCARIDMPDIVFATRRAKGRALLKEIGEAHAIGRPVLAGTGSVSESEELASALAAAGIPCEVLNAKNDEREAELIARAGRFGAVTISTNMAGRGTDIRLGDDERVYCAGGLYVIGTNRHESERIDDQLRGRAGRQGEPGQSRFFLSLEDPLFQRYGIPEFLPDWRLSPSGKGAHSTEPEAPLPEAATREVARAQRLIAGQNHAIRRNLRKYTELLEYDRRSLRSLRDDALLRGAFPEKIEEHLSAAIAGTAKTGESDGMVSGGLADMRAHALEDFLVRLDNFWADHLKLVDEVREGIHLVRYAAKDPLREYIRTVGGAFEAGLEAAIEATANFCRRSGDATAEGESADRGEKPSSTWTYLVEEEETPAFSLSALPSSDIGRSIFAAFPLMVLDWIDRLRQRRQK